jgi:ADP-ribose pyrophosphatase
VSGAGDGCAKLAAVQSPTPLMAPLPPPEPARHLETTAALDARKIRFEINRMLLPIGLEGSFGIIRHPGASLAVPVLDDGRVVILRQYRFAVAGRLLEFPAGTLDEGEDPLTTMERELQEESGYSAALWDPLGAMHPCPGYSDEVIHLFLARQLTALPDPPPGDDDEDMEVLLMEPSELDAAIAGGHEALDGKSVTAWFLAKRLLGL